MTKGLKEALDRELGAALGSGVAAVFMAYGIARAPRGARIGKHQTGGIVMAAGGEIPFEGQVRALRKLKQLSAETEAIRRSIRSAVGFATDYKGSGSGGKWTLADCSAVVRGMVKRLAAAAACVAVAAGCALDAAGPHGYALRAAGPHGYVRFEDVDPDEEFLRYADITNLVAGAGSHEAYAVVTNAATLRCVYGTNVVPVPEGGTLAVDLAGWVDGQSVFTRVVPAGSYAVSAAVSLAGYGIWPAVPFDCVAWKSGDRVYVTVLREDD